MEFLPESKWLGSLLQIRRAGFSNHLKTAEGVLTQEIVNFPSKEKLMGIGSSVNTNYYAFLFSATTVVMSLQNEYLYELLVCINNADNMGDVFFLHIYQYKTPARK